MQIAVSTTWQIVSIYIVVSTTIYETGGAGAWLGNFWKAAQSLKKNWPPWFVDKENLGLRNN